MQQVKVRHIQVDSRDLAEDIIDFLEEGQQFVDLALQYSTCPSAKNEGDLGWIDPLDTASVLGIPLSETVVEIGTRIGPLSTLFGYHIVEVTDIRELEPAHQTAS